MVFKGGKGRRGVEGKRRGVKRVVREGEARCEAESGGAVWCGAVRCGAM